MTCTNYCTGLQQMSFWCDDDPCKLGTGDPDFQCECVTNGWAVAGIVIGCVVVFGGIAICLIIYCIMKQRRRQQAAMHAQMAANPTYTYSPTNVYAQPTQQIVIVGVAQPQPTYATPSVYQQQQYPAYNPNGSPADGYGAAPTTQLQEQLLGSEVPPFVQNTAEGEHGHQGYYHQ